MNVRDAEAGELLTALLDELRALRQETARQTALLEAMVAALAEIKRTQDS